MKIIHYFQLALVMLVISGCSNASQQDIGVYAYNMLYACDCPRYKIFRVDDLSDNTIKLKDCPRALDIDTSDEKISNEIDSALNMKTNEKSLIGRDIALEFKNLEYKKLFDKQEAIAPICYIYYFEGALKSKSTFLVKKFKLIPKSPNCILK